jgi:hypothetical protein
VAAALSVLCASACTSLAAPRSAAATLRFGAAHHHERSLHEHDAARALALDMSTRLAAAAGAQRAWAAAALHALPTSSASCAWALSPAAAPPVDGCVTLLSQVFGVGHTLAATARARTLAANGALSDAEAVAFDEGDEFVATSLQFLARAAALLAHARACATADAYIASADAVIEACAAFVSGIADAYTRRRAWTQAALRGAAQQADAAGAGGDDADAPPQQRRYAFTADDSLRLPHLLALANVAIA